MNFRITLVTICMMISSQFLLAQKSYNALVYEGNKKFDAKEYDASSSRYLEAIAEKNNNYTAHYNLGNALYKSKKYEEATAEYEKAAKYTKSKYEKAAALYNLGNVSIQSNNPEKAANYYKQALKEDPYNEAIRKNYEIAMLKDKEKKDQQKQKQNKGKGGDQDQKNKDDSDKGNQKKNQQDGKGDDQKGKDQGKPTQPKEENKIPREAERQILKDIENREKETARRILNKKSNSMPQSKEKDW